MLACFGPSRLGSKDACGRVKSVKRLVEQLSPSWVVVEMSQCRPFDAESNVPMSPGSSDESKRLLSRSGEQLLASDGTIEL